MLFYCFHSVHLYSTTDYSAKYHGIGGPSCASLESTLTLKSNPDISQSPKTDISNFTKRTSASKYPKKRRMKIVRIQNTGTHVMYSRIILCFPVIFPCHDRKELMFMI